MEIFHNPPNHLIFLINNLQLNNFSQPCFNPVSVFHTNISKPSHQLTSIPAIYPELIIAKIK